MDPRHLSSFLEKYKNLPTPKSYLKDIVNEFLGIADGVSDVSLTGSTLYVKAPGAIKQKLFLKKRDFIKLLEERGVSLTITDIR